MTDLSLLDATAQAELVRTGQATPAELLDAAIDRIERVNDELNAVITPLFDRAAAALDDLPDGPFRGVPIVLKDHDGALGGAPYHHGMRVLREAGYVAPESDLNIARLEAAGFVVVGKSNTPELGLVPTTEPEAYGPTRNPWDPTRSSGGSSGGTAAAVAAGLVPIGTAGDGGGSIRIPASECGLVGLKPTRARVPVGPTLGEDWAGLVVRGVITRTVRDAAAALDVLSAPDAGAPYQAPPLPRPLAQELATDPAPLRIGLRTDAPVGTATTDPEIVAAVEEVARLLESLGHTVEVSSPPALDEEELVGQFFPAFGTWVAGGIDQLGAALGRTITADDVEPATWSLVEMGRATAATQYTAALEWFHAWSRRVKSWWGEGWDVLLTPTIPELPPVLGQFGAEPGNPLAGSMRAAALVPFMIPFNITGQPGISLPLSASAAGLPIGSQLVAATGREDLLVRIAGQLERARPWADRRPSIHA